MDSSPSKRRRTSPSTSIAVTVENTDLGLLPQNGASPSRRRSSFMSPTKASLARFHPSLLRRAKSAEPPRPVSEGTHSSVEQDSAISDRKNGIVVHVAGSDSEELNPVMNGVEKRQGLLATPRRRSRTLGESSASAHQDPCVTSPNPRASPPEEAREEGTAVNGTNGGQQEPVAEVADTGDPGITVVPDSQKPQLLSTPKQCGPYFPTSGMGIGEDGEPSLPSTLSQLGLEPPREKPKGLLFSSPSRRSRRKGRSSAKSSPLKPSNVPPEHSYQKQKISVANLGPRRYIANTPKPSPSPEEAHLLELQSRLDDVEKQLQDVEDKVLRQLLTSSWQQDRGREGKYMAKQKKEVIQRRIKIVQLRDEILRIKAAKSIEVRPEAVDQKVVTTKPYTLTQRLAEFLPFSIGPQPPQPRSHFPKNKDVNHILDSDIMQTAAAPFTITTSNTSLLPSTADNDLLRRQDVTLSAPQQLLTCNLQFTTNITAHQITELDIQALTSWAEPELGSWLRKSREKMEVAALGRAFGRYWEVAKLRGKCWISCKQEYTHLVANSPESTSALLYFGMQDFVFARSNVQLKVTWRISLSDQGEVESHSSAYPRFPAAWQQEANSELTKVGDAFMMLVEDRGISEAIGMICKVVFPT